MKSILFICAIFLAFVMTVQSAPQPPQKSCGANEQFVTCGTACPLVCGKPVPQFCTYQCVIGCQCNKGYYRHANGRCVLQRDC